MSYYYNTKYHFSHHALVRIKSRLNLNHLSEIEIKDFCLKLIDESYEITETKTLKYVKINKKNLYFIIEKSDSLIKTLSPISPERLLAIIENDL